MFIDEFNAIVIFMLYVYLTMAVALMLYSILIGLSKQAEDERKDEEK